MPFIEANERNNHQKQGSTVSLASFLSVSIFSSFWAQSVHRYLGTEGDANSLRRMMGRKYGSAIALYFSVHLFAFVDLSKRTI